MTYSHKLMLLSLKNMFFSGLIYNLGKQLFQLKHALNNGLQLVCVNITVAHNEYLE